MTSCDCASRYIPKLSTPITHIHARVMSFPDHLHVWRYMPAHGMSFPEDQNGMSPGVTSYVCSGGVVPGTSTCVTSYVCSGGVVPGTSTCVTSYVCSGGVVPGTSHHTRHTAAFRPCCANGRFLGGGEISCDTRDLTSS